MEEGGDHDKEDEHDEEDEDDDKNDDPKIRFSSGHIRQWWNVADVFRRRRDLSSVNNTCSSTLSSI